jgi:hypothetical protein
MLQNGAVVSCALPVGERIVDIVPGGTELEIQLRRGVGQAAHTRNNPHVMCTGVWLKTSRCAKGIIIKIIEQFSSWTSYLMNGWLHVSVRTGPSSGLLMNQVSNAAYIDSTQQKQLCNFNTVQQFYKSHICETTRWYHSTNEFTLTRDTLRCSSSILQIIQ